MAIISDLLRIIAKPIILKLGKGLKSSKNKYCLGEELDIRLDIDEIQLSCDGTVTENAFPRWNEDGKCLKDSKTIQDDNGNTSTRTSADTLSYITSNESEDENSVAVHAVESKGGRPINRLFIPGKQLVDSYISNRDYSYNIFLNDIENAGLAADCLTINREGNVTTPRNYYVSAYYPGRSPNFDSGIAIALGSERKLTIIEQTGNNFFPGGGGNGATYTFNEPHTVLVTMSFVLQKDAENAQLEGSAQIERRGSINQFYYSLSNIGPTFGKVSVHLTRIIRGQAGDVLYFYVGGVSKDWYINNPYDPKLTSFIDICCIG